MCAHDRAEPAVITPKELGECNKPERALLAVRGKVYNVTEFVERHPGGRDILLMAAGRDVTQVFETYHDEKAEKVLSPYTNVPDADPDIDVASVHFRRIRKDQTWYPFYLLQHVYAPVMYSLYGLKSRYDDIAILYFSKRRGSIPVNPLTPSQHALFWGGKAFFVFHRLVLPAFFMPLSQVLYFFVLADLATAWTLALVFQANHVVQHVDWPTPDPKTNTINQDWMELQIRTAQDYSHDGFLTTKLTGGLNYQVVHHAFPQICQWYYPEIAPIVKSTCKEFGVPYTVRKDFWEAIGDHVRLLWDLGRDARVEKKAK
ncbi:uncharacterized protein SPPG_08969 [Spizellomyces punctatus DAOM BR117]|uniref:Cytochrome b5 heme-binding domain-containing protein n=1 Tax=Spizellomyces punctatus (strain DAOM BR117) TaxID=645134 RepID=A0A0L0HPI0_SPIPD|nr:uncharacterized protein SPPG_08969 [Spizellomyces punctatus DAOM BR117]KND02875.1 hypothetical protein SPPG_08969 [Spizellomyces punctatus DAOM BR117]|eukprot:XP_016610914.1 hypothetical protein SPPG_08969 [Spizellomyces punctatus DAOM BR117]